jgi:hypothetical protein
VLRLACINPLARLLLLMRGQDRLAAELDASGLGVGPATRGAFHDAPAFELGGNPQHGEHQLGEVGCRIDNRLGQ